MHYNLCDEPWILLMKKDGQVDAAGLEKAFTNLQDYMSFAGEIQLQDTAMLRLFTAISVTMIYRMNADGQEDFTTDKKRLMERFRTIWEQGKFPEAIVNGYFRRWHDRFDLTGDERPFFQVPEAIAKSVIKKKGKDLETRYHLPSRAGELKEMNRKPLAAINGMILDSNNKPAAYADIVLPEKDGIQYMPLAEGARWLLWYMAFADCGTKSPGPAKWASKMTLPGAGALVYPQGGNLFETVMLNSVLLKADGEPYECVQPAWEKELSVFVQDEPYKNSAPQNLPELYTQQSRRIIFRCTDFGVIDAHVIAGDWYAATDIDPMFLWKEIQSGQDEPISITIKYNTDSSWTTLRNILLALGTDGNMRWIKLLRKEGLLQSEKCSLQLAGIEYGNTQSVIKKMASDEIVIDTRFLENESDKKAMESAVSTVNELASKFYVFGRDLAASKGAGSEFSGAQGKDMAQVFLNEAEILLRHFLKGMLDETQFDEQLQTVCRTISEQEMEQTDMSAYMNGTMTAAMAESNLRKASRMIFKRKEEKE